MPRLIVCLPVLLLALFTNLAETLAGDLKRDRQREEKITKLKDLEHWQRLNRPAGSASAGAPMPVIFHDNFEGGAMAWQVSAGWGSTPQEDGFANAGKSDWQLITGNANSGSRSWRETEAAAIQTDMLLSPVIRLPEILAETGGRLRHVNLSFALDWDAPDPEAQLRIYAGRAETLWAFDSRNPGAGRSAWRCTVPDTGHYTEFLRQFLITPEIDLTRAAEPVRLSFLYQSFTEANFDYNTVEVSSDNFAGYKTLIAFTGGEAGAAWKSYSLNLAAFIGTKVRIRFTHSGDFSIVAPGTVFALDEIKVTAGSTTLFSDNGGETGETRMVRAGFAPGNQLAVLQGIPNPAPAWAIIAPGWLGIDLLAGSNGSVVPGDSIRLGLVYVASKTSLPRRGIHIDDITVSGIAKPDRDVAAVEIVAPFPAVVGRALRFGLRVANTGLEYQTNLTWQATVRDSTGKAVFQLSGASAQLLLPDSTAVIPAQQTWTPEAPGLYTLTAYTHAGGDEAAFNDTTSVLQDDDARLRAGAYSRLLVLPEQLVFAANLEEAPFDSTPATLQRMGLQVQSHGAAGAATWHTGRSPHYDFRGALILADAAGRHQVEDLIIPDLDFSNAASNARLSFKGLAAGGATYSRLAVGVSSDSGQTWNEVFDQRLGTDPQTGIKYSDTTIVIAPMNPAALDLTPLAAGRRNVAIRFRYESRGDGFWLLWQIALSGRSLQPPQLRSVSDVPEDQGKQVQLLWSAAPADDAASGAAISYYRIWRGLPQDTTGKSHRSRAAASLAWEPVGTLPARGDSSYHFIARTRGDGIATAFYVSGHAANPEVFANSNIVSGTSVDNLPPAAPHELEAQITAAGITLHWNPPPNEIPAFYTILRSHTSGDYSSPALANTRAAWYEDASAAPNQAWFYVVTATDSSGNSSPHSNEVAVVVTGIAAATGEKPPATFALRQNHPNPCNPATIISYQMPEAGVVRLRILNALGQEIRALVLGMQPAGYHAVRWDGLDRHGRLVGSGIYFYHLEAGGFAATRKLAVVR